MDDDDDDDDDIKNNNNNNKPSRIESCDVRNTTMV
jgi:hypothetical protein